MCIRDSCGTFENCVNECTVYAKTGVAGGIIGDYYNKGNQKFLSLISCENKGNIRSGLSTAGGLAASATAATNVVFKNCINTDVYKRQSFYFIGNSIGFPIINTNLI